MVVKESGRSPLKSIYRRLTGNLSQYTKSISKVTQIILID